MVMQALRRKNLIREHLSSKEVNCRCGRLTVGPALQLWDIPYKRVWFGVVCQKERKQKTCPAGCMFEVPLQAQIL